MDRRTFSTEISALLLSGLLPLRLEENSRWLEWVSEPDSADYWKKIRHEFLVPDDVAYLNNGSLGLSPRPVIEAIHHHLLETESVKSRKYGDYPWWGYSPSLEIRKTLGDFLGAAAEEIALTRNATEGINTVANGLDLNVGDEVLMTNQEHPGGRSAWYQRAKRYGIVVKEFELPFPPKSPAEVLEKLEAAVTPRTRVISVSHITTVTGGILPVKEICALARGRNIVSLIDGAHAIGQIPLDMHDMGCDYYATSPHKWLYAPKGTGALYCRKGMAERLWCHTASGTWDKPELGCERLTNVGTSNLTLLIGLVAAIDFYNRIGSARILSRENYLARTLRSELAQITGVWFGNGAPPDLSAAMVKVMLPVRKLDQLPNKLWEDHKIWVAAADAAGKLPPSIRLSCPIYLTEDDLHRTVAILKQELTR